MNELRSVSHLFRKYTYIPHMKQNLSTFPPTLYSRIDVGPTFINFGFFPGPMALLKALCLSIFGIFSRPYWYSQVWFVFVFKMVIHPTFDLFCQTFQALWLSFCQMFLGPIFILFDKFSRPYVYSGVFQHTGSVMANWFFLN